AKQTKDARDDDVRREDERHQERRGPSKRTEQPEDQARRPLACHGLGDDLAKHQHDRCDHRRGHEPGPAPEGLEQQHRGDRRRDDVRDGHAHHGGRQDTLGAAERLEVACGRLAALLGEVAQAQPIGGDERHFGGGEEHRRQQAERGNPRECHAAFSVDCGVRSERRTSKPRVRSIFSTVTESSGVSTRSPRRGTRPNRSSTHPPTVSYASLEIARPVAALRSSTGSLPATRYVRASIFWIRRSGSSYSSALSPTSSSSRSSSATSPAVPPYSSTTMAMCSFLAWNSCSSASARLDSGTKYGGARVH